MIAPAALFSRQPAAPESDRHGRTGRRHRPPDGPDNPFVAMSGPARHVLLGLLAVYTCVCVFGALSKSADNSASALLALSDFVYMAALAYPLLTYKPERDGWFHPLVFGTLWVMVKSLPRRMDVMIFGITEHAVLGLPPEELTGLLAYENFLNALALAATYAGYHFIRNPWMPKLRFHEPRHLWVWVGVAAAVAIAALGYNFIVAGGVTQHLLNLSLNQTAKVFAKEVEGMGHIQVAAQSFVVAAIVLLAYRAELLRKPYFWLILCAAIMNYYLVAGKRSVIATSALNAAIVWMLCIRKVPYVRLLALGAALFGLFSVLLVVRGASTMSGDLTEVWERASIGIDESLSLGAEELTNRVGSYTSIHPILHQVPDEVPLLWGQTYLNILTAPIPRALWPEKPRGADFMAGVIFFGAPWGVPAGPVGEAFWNFHIPGVIGVFFLWGVFSRWLVNFYLAHGSHGLVKYLYAYALFLAPSQNMFVFSMQMMLPVLALGWAAGIIRFRGKTGA